MGLKKNSKITNQIPHWGTVKKVKVGVYTKNGFVKSIFPCYFQKGGVKNEKL